MPRIAVIVPWRGGCPHREDAWGWVRERYRREYPDWELITASAPAGPFNKASAINTAITRTNAELLVVADADAWCDSIGNAVISVRGGAPWAIPHRYVCRLSGGQTAWVLAGLDPAPAAADDRRLAEPPHIGAAGGGIAVLPLATAKEIPLDERFTGWGGEDLAWGYALTTLAGRPWRGGAPLWHLWHPAQQRATRIIGSPANEQLRKCYIRALGHPDQMNRLISEATVS